MRSKLCSPFWNQRSFVINGLDFPCLYASMNTEITPKTAQVDIATRVMWKTVKGANCLFCPHPTLNAGFVITLFQQWGPSIDAFKKRGRTPCSLPYALIGGLGSCFPCNLCV